jgi:hypothetical protein
MRAFIVALGLVYLSRLNIKSKKDPVVKLINNNKMNSIIEEGSYLDYDAMQSIKKFEEDDFSKRIKVNY